MICPCLTCTEWTKESCNEWGKAIFLYGSVRPRMTESHPTRAWIEAFSHSAYSSFAPIGSDLPPLLTDNILSSVQFDIRAYKIGWIQTSTEIRPYTTRQNILIQVFDVIWAIFKNKYCQIATSSVIDGFRVSKVLLSCRYGWSHNLWIGATASYWTINHEPNSYLRAQSNRMFLLSC